jgi:catechol 2,3-dioxygenase-like lactoylglutathione lyase family enzyme
VIGQFPLFPNIPAQDLARAKEWYTEKLGLVPVAELPFGVFFRSGDAAFMVYATPSAGSARHTLASWIVNDIGAVMRELRAQGVVFEEYDLAPDGPTTVNGIATDPSGGRAAWFKDSEGNILGLAEASEELAILISAT